MPRSTRLATIILLGTALAIAALCAPTPLAATDFPHFDHMNGAARAEFLARMVDTMEQTLRDAGHPDVADQVEKLFNTVEGEDSATLGMVEMELNVGAARAADAENLVKNANARRLDVEVALFATLKNNMLQLTPAEMREVVAKMATFHATTYREFEALSASNRSRLIHIVANWAFFSYMSNSAVEDKLKGKSSDTAQEKRESQMERRVVNEEFLASAGPGYSKLTQEITAEYAKNPDQPNLTYTVVLYILDEVDNQIKSNIQNLRNNAVVIH